MAVIAFVTGFATPMFGRMMLYFSAYVLQRPGFASEALGAITLAQFPGVLLWTSMIRHREKTTLLAVGHGVAMLGILLFASVGPHPTLLLCCAALTGIGLAAVYMLPWAIVADVVDFSEFRYGERRETATFAMFLVIIKASGAASIALIGWTMAMLGYAPGATQSQVVRTGITLLAFAVPLLGGLAATAVVLRLSMSHRRHASVVRQLDARRRSVSRVERIRRVHAGRLG
jgi:GPH family glycoside/pentoside/hexuronide:cation symporter